MTAACHEEHREMRVDADSHVHVCRLDDAERSQRMANLNNGMKISNKRLQHVADKLALQSKKLHNLKSCVSILRMQ